MGLHTGAPTVTPEGYVGVDVHRGARIGALAHGRQILVSPTTAALLDDASLLDLGTHRLRTSTARSASISSAASRSRSYEHLGPSIFPPLPLASSDVSASCSTLSSSCTTATRGS
jgi:hypothetical protein